MEKNLEKFKLNFQPTKLEKKILTCVNKDGLLSRKHVTTYLQIMQQALTVDDRSLCLVPLKKVSHPNYPKLRMKILIGSEHNGGGLFHVLWQWVQEMKNGDEQDGLLLNSSYGELAVSQVCVYFGTQ